uniref:Uncharacterized protein n=1 Tax=Plectus sambesii TaxID=2011161 RepID=A0A914XJE5_9BILA
MVPGALSEQSAYLLALLLNALHGLIFFYERDYQELNVDGLFGNGGLSAEIVDDIKNLSSYAGRLANKALPHVFERDPAYFNKFKYLIHRPYDVTHGHRLTDSRLQWADAVLNSNAAKKPFTERQSDKCFAELLGSAAEPIRQSTACNASTPCLDYMLGRRGLTQYKLTHQVLYMAIAEVTDCTPTVEKFMASQGSSVEKFVLEWCSNVVREINLLEQSNSHLVGLSFMLKDLLMEQVFTCGQFGFVEVARTNLLTAFLSWQDPQLGCFRKSDSAAPDAAKFGGRKILSELVAKGFDILTLVRLTRPLSVREQSLQCSDFFLILAQDICLISEWMLSV